MISRTYLPILLAVISFFAAIPAQAGIVKDHITNSVNWSGERTTPSNYGATVRYNTVASFTGDGGVISKVGVLVGVASSSGVPNGADISGMRVHVTFYDDFNDFVGNSFVVDDSLPGTKLFTTPSNTNWMDIVGTSFEGIHLRYAEFDVLSEGWVTTPGAVQGLALLPSNIQGGFSRFALSSGSSAIGTEYDWFRAVQVSSGNTISGPGTLQSVGAPLPFAAFYVETVAVPEASSFVLAVVGLIGVVAVRRFRAVAAACLVGLISFAAIPAQAGIVKDHVTNSANWSGQRTTPSHDGPAIRYNTAAAFTGDGGIISKVGVLVGGVSSLGVPNGADISGMRVHVTFYEDFDDFAANSFATNDSLPGTKLFTTPSNADWLDIVGTSFEGIHLRYAEFDVLSEGWVTTPGAVQGLALLPSNIQGGISRFALSNGSSAIGNEFDWFRAVQVSTGNTLSGPGTLQSVGAPLPFAAFYVETVAVPETSSLLLATVGLFGLGAIRQFRKRALYLHLLVILGCSLCVPQYVSAGPIVSGTATLTVYSAASPFSGNISTVGTLYFAGISGDGTTVFGGNWPMSTDANDGIYRLGHFLDSSQHDPLIAKGGALVGLPNLSGYKYADVWGASNNGDVLVGAAAVSAYNVEAVYWNSAGVHRIFPGSSKDSIASVVSRDGSTILAYGEPGVAWKYTGGAVTELPADFRIPHDISSDNRIIVGTGLFRNSAISPSGMYRKPAVIEDGELRPLIEDGNLYLQGDAFGISADGSTIVGQVNRFAGYIPGPISPRAVKWTEILGEWVMSELDTSPLNGGFVGTSQAIDVSADGSRIIGEYTGLSGGNVFGFISLDGHSTIDFNEYIASLGISVPSPWANSPLVPTGISDDGNTIVGRISRPYEEIGPESMAWTLKFTAVPEASSLLLVGVGLIGVVAVRRFRAAVAVCLIGFVSFAGSTAQAGIVKDHVTNSLNWSGERTTPSNYGGSFRFNTVASFTGDGGVISKVGVLVGVVSQSGVPNGAGISEMRTHITFYDDFGDFSSNSFVIDDSLPGTKLFTTPSNADWLDIVGTSFEGIHLRYAEFDVLSEGWVTTPGAVQGLALLPSNIQGGISRFALSNGSSAIGNESDWFRAVQVSSGNTISGPGTLQSVGAPLPFAAFYVETVAVPEASSLLLAAVGLIGLVAIRRFRVAAAACLVGLVSFASIPAQAGIVKDHVTDSVNWSGERTTPSNDGTSVRYNTVGAFTGDGGVISKVGVLVGVVSASGVPNGADISGMRVHATFYQDFADFASNSFVVDDSLPRTKLFTTPSNADWLDIVGTSFEGIHLRYAEFDVLSEGWVTTPGAVQGLALLPSNIQGGISRFALSNGSSAIGSESDWLRAVQTSTGITFAGPTTLEDLGAPQPFAAFYVETTAVPEASSLLLAAVGLIGVVAVRQFRKTSAI